MSTLNTEDLRIESITDVSTPAQIHQEFPISSEAAAVVDATRAQISGVLAGRDDRVLVIVGPCSIHDPIAAREYAARLLPLRNELNENLLIVMRVYFEKPRTTVGWKGLINDPDLDNQFNINKGLRTARALLLELNNSGMPAGTEFLDVITPQYVTDLVSWGAIGARTTESQVHREMASGLSCPVGFKNGTDGTVQIAIDAIRAARHSHVFLAMTQSAQSAIFKTTGNQDSHIILRGGHEPNYDAKNVAATAQSLTKAKLEPAVMVDFSHANSLKQPERQKDVCSDVAMQIAGGDKCIVGVMIESHLKGGRQDATPGAKLEYGVSITDGCVDFDSTESMLRELATAVKQRRG